MQSSTPPGGSGPPGAAARARPGRDRPAPGGDAWLPEPSPEALDHSARLVARIGERIDAAGGWIPFSEYMRLALYAPGLGYYAAGARKLGPEGDFVTAPEISPLFGGALARFVADALASSGGGVLELGAGSGAMAQQVLDGLEALGAAPERYAILETSPDLASRQRERLEAGGAGAPGRRRARVEWLDRLPGRWRGVVLANEVLDAVPVEVVGRRDGRWWRHGVVRGAAGAAFAWEARVIAPGERLHALAGARLPAVDGYVAEIGEEAEALVRTLAASLARGLALVIDYGFPRPELYHPQRSQGTLMCHYRHRAHADPFFLPGLQDITAHVDFTAVADAAREGGCDVLGYATQARLLLGCGIGDLLLASGEPGSLDYLRAATAVQRLLGPAEMGERVKALAFGRGVDAPPRAFIRDRG